MLRERGHRLASGSDTEVLVHLYEEYGADLVHALEGMFAFAIWDSRERTLLACRDRFGEKPLFYSANAGQLTFASELTVLAAGAGLNGGARPARRRRILRLRLRARTRLDPAGVRQLPPGHLLRWSAGREPAIESYWTRRPATDPGAETTADLAAELGRLLGNRFAAV